MNYEVNGGILILNYKSYCIVIEEMNYVFIWISWTSNDIIESYSAYIIK